MGNAVGVIGLGIMGGAMAKNLVAAGWEVFGFDRDRKRQSALEEQGVQNTSSVAELTEKAEVIFTSLPTSAAFHSTMWPIAAANRRKIVVDTSTLSLEDKFKAKKELDNAGHIALDCPISGTGAQAVTKDLVVYASGDSDAIASIKPIFLGFARQVYDTGVFGNGSRMKFVANLLVAVHNVAAAEAMVLAAKAGLDLHQVIRLISDGAGTSRVFELRAPLMAERCYEPATMKNSVWQKDLFIINEFAESLACPIPLLSATLPIYSAALAKGHGDQDTASVYTVLESMADGQRARTLLPRKRTS